MPRHLSGIQPSGLPHLGNYFGAIAQHVEVSKAADPAAKDALFFIADYHALTSLHDKAALEENVRSVAATYLALGLDTERAVFFRQSDIPEVTELMWLLMTVTGMGLLERAHSYKDKTARGLHPNVGLFTYPVLMAADIVIYDSEVVPVGHDQIQHVEMTQDMVTHFNTAFGGEHLKRPQWQLSKTYNNAIWIFDEGKALKKSVNAIVTDSRPPEEPKDPDGVNAFALLDLFLDEAERADWRARIQKGGVGYGHLKGALIEKMDARFGAARGTYQELMKSEAGKQRLEETLARGAAQARPLAQATLARCFEAVGMGNAARRLGR